MDPQTEIKTAAGGKKTQLKRLDLLPESTRGLHTQFMAYLERNGFDADIKYPAILTHLCGDGTNLLDPENVKALEEYAKIRAYHRIQRGRLRRDHRN